MNVNAVEIKRIFDQAIEIKDQQQRQQFVDEACSDHPELHDELNALLIAHDNAGSFLAFEDNRVALDEIARQPADLIGEKIGPFAVTERIGEGGFGVVYRARQSEPMQREVAIKLLKPGIDSSEVSARFDAERNLLARMNHSNIARVIDGGFTQNGVPYFVMELVEGQSIVDYCDANQLTIKQRLQLFIQVCNGVHHAHQKGIIHRDLKPRNVLITKAETDQPIGTAKIIDFGIAKVALQADNLASENTRRGQVLGTPMYMSPEQAGMGDGDVDSRSDIYSLGIILFELLTGSTPLSKKDVESSRFDEVLRAIRDNETSKPSNHVKDNKEDSDSISENRCTRPTQLANILKGDLDWIVLTAVAKSPDRRYDSAAAFARDIQRYLEGDPIEARAPSWSYQTKKFVAKHKVIISVVAICAMVLLSATIFSLWQAQRAVANQRRADRAFAAEKKAKLKAINKERIAEAALKSELQERRAFEGLWRFTHDSMVSPVFSGPEYHAETAIVLEKKAAKAEEIFAGLPKAKAEVFQMIAYSFGLIGSIDREIEFLEQAVKQYEIAHGKQHQQTVIARCELASVLARNEFFVQAAQMLPDESEIDLETPIGLECLIGVLLTQSKIKLDNMERDLALAKSQQAIELADKHFPKNSQIVRNAYHVHAANLQLSKSLTAAKNYYIEVLTRICLTEGPQSVPACNVMHSLGVTYISMGNQERGKQLIEHAIETSLLSLSSDHPAYVELLKSQARAMELTGQIEEAIEVYRNVLEITLKYPETRGHLLPKYYNDLGYALTQLERREEATELMQQAYQAAVKYIGPDSPTTLVCGVNVAASLSWQRKFEQGIDLIEDLLPRIKRHWGPNHRQTIETMETLAGIAATGGNYPLAIKVREQLVDIYQQRNDFADTEKADARFKLGCTYIDAGQFDQALPHIDFAFSTRLDVLGPDDIKTLQGGYKMGQCLMGIQRLDDAKSYYAQTYERQLKVLGKEHLHTIGSLEGIAQTASLSGENAKAARYYEQVLDLKTKTLGTNAHETWDTKAALAITYYRLKRYDTAEPLLRECASPPDAAECTAEYLFNTNGYLAFCYLDSEKYKLAAQQLERLGTEFPPTNEGHIKTLESKKLDLMIAYYGAGDEGKTDALIEEYFNERAGAAEENRMVIVGTCASIAGHMDRYGFYEKARDLMKRAFDVCKEEIPQQHIRFNVEESYGGAILKCVIHYQTIDAEERERQLKKAEQHLLNSQENILRINKSAGLSTSFIYDRNLKHLILLYETWNKNEQQQKWENALAEIEKGRKDKGD